MFNRQDNTWKYSNWTSRIVFLWIGKNCLSLFLTKERVFMKCNKIIKSLRLQNEYSQQTVADKLKISQRTYADYELRKDKTFFWRTHWTCKVL